MTTDLSNIDADTPAPEVSVGEAARVLLDREYVRRQISERIHQNTDASSVGQIEVALMHALRALAEGGE